MNENDPEQEKHLIDQVEDLYRESDERIFEVLHKLCNLVIERDTNE